MVTLLAAMATGATQALPLDDPGVVVRWGRPLLSLITTIASSATVGLLGFAAFLTPETTRTDRRGEAMRLATRTAWLWAVAGLLSVVFTFSDLAGVSPTSGGFLNQLMAFTWSLETTRVELISALLALFIALAASTARSRWAMSWLTALGILAVVILALTGHAGGSADHESAVNSLAVHLLGATVWVGGLLALVLLRPRLGRDLGVTVARYSTIALWAYAAIALSGIQQAVIRIGSFADLGTAYGALVLVKVVVLALLGLAGWQQRRVIAARLAKDPADGGAFRRLALVEIVLMGAAFGLGAALSYSAPPVPETQPNPSRVLELTGYPDPGPMSGADWLTAWRVEWLFLAIGVLGIGLYLAGVVRLHRRGDVWPWGRTISWVIGWLIWIYATNGAPEIWGRVLFSVHMVMHMIVAMIVPLFLVPGAPITLALRALTARRDKTWGPREVIVHFVHSTPVRWLGNPVIAAVLFFFSLAIFYWSPLFGIALTTHVGHLLMMAHFFLTGFLFTWVLIGIDPGPPKWSPLMLLVILFATISFHAFFGVNLTGAESLLAHDFFTQINLPWGPDLLADQHRAGEIAWGIGEAPTLVLAMMVARNWVKSDRAETRRKDRQADRDDDAELRAYNEYLGQMRERMKEDR